MCDDPTVLPTVTYESDDSATCYRVLSDGGAVGGLSQDVRGLCLSLPFCCQRGSWHIVLFPEKTNQSRKCICHPPPLPLLPKTDAFVCGAAAGLPQPDVLSRAAGRLLQHAVCYCIVQS